jgi:hypothetical protein
MIMAGRGDVPGCCQWGCALLRKLALTVVLALSSLAVKADDLTPYLLEFGTARSQLWGILAERPEGGSSYAFALADQLGLNPDRGTWPYRAAATLRFSPLLGFDRNVNNGFVGDVISISGIPYRVEEASKAVRAVAIGAAVSGAISFGVAQGTTLTFSGRGAYERAVGKRFEVFNSTAAVNLGYTAQDWTYANAGFLVNEERRDLGDESIKVASWTIGRIFGEAHSHLHDLSGTFVRAEENATWQSRLRVDWTGTFADYGVFKVGLEGGEEIEGTLLPRVTVTAAYSNLIFGKPTTISAVYTHKTGGLIFGETREDHTYRVSLDRKINERFSISVSAERKDSSLDSFDDSYIDIGFQITGFGL